MIEWWWSHPDRIMDPFGTNLKRIKNCDRLFNGIEYCQRKTERESRHFLPRLSLLPTKIIYPVFKLKITNFVIKLMFTKQNICSVIIFMFIECISTIVSISEKILLCHSPRLQLTYPSVLLNILVHSYI